MPCVECKSVTAELVFHELYKDSGVPGESILISPARKAYVPLCRRCDAHASLLHLIDDVSEEVAKQEEQYLEALTKTVDDPNSSTTLADIAQMEDPTFRLVRQRQLTLQQITKEKIRERVAIRHKMAQQLEWFPAEKRGEGSARLHEVPIGTITQGIDLGPGPPRSKEVGLKRSAEEAIAGVTRMATDVLLQQGDKSSGGLTSKASAPPPASAPHQASAGSAASGAADTVDNSLGPIKEEEASDSPIEQAPNSQGRAPVQPVADSSLGQPQAVDDAATATSPAAEPTLETSPGESSADTTPQPVSRRFRHRQPYDSPSQDADTDMSPSTLVRHWEEQASAMQREPEADPDTSSTPQSWVAASLMSMRDPPPPVSSAAPPPPPSSSRPPDGSHVAPPPVEGNRRPTRATPGQRANPPLPSNALNQPLVDASGWIHWSQAAWEARPEPDELAKWVAAGWIDHSDDQ